MSDGILTDKNNARKFRPGKAGSKKPWKMNIFNLKSCKFGSDDVPFQLGDFLCSMFVFSGAGAFTTTCRMLKNP